MPTLQLGSSGEGRGGHLRHSEGGERRLRHPFVPDEVWRHSHQAQGFAEVGLRVKESHTSNSVRVIVNGRFQTLVDDNAKAQGEVPCQIRSVSGAQVDETGNGYRFELNKDEWLKIQFLSEPYDPSWYVNFSLEIRNE